MIFAANFKMNKTQKEILEYFSNFNFDGVNSNIMFALPYTSLSLIKKLPQNNILYGSQNVHFAKKGAFTGEISIEMIKELGADFSLIAHSERRQFFGETDESAALRAQAALDSGLKVIFCVGENHRQRRANRTKFVLKRQLIKGLKNINNSQNLIVAYEPVWAIGTGKSATATEIQSTHAFIKGVLFSMFKTDIPVLYGGSVNIKNINDICNIKNVDGVLVGGASLSPDTMRELIISGSKK